MRVRIKLEFDGAPFCGWQLQSERQELNRPSIQGTIEKALGVALRTQGERIILQGCSRTDAGVHAEVFFCHADLPDASEIELERLRHRLNGLLPETIALTALDHVPDFHALRDVQNKTYEYRLLVRRTKPVLMKGRVHWIPLEPDLFDRDSIRQALHCLEGQHDFRAFTASHSSVQSTVRRMTRCEFIEERPFPSSWPRESLIRLCFTGQGFLKQMIRNLAGTLVEIGEGRRDIASLKSLLSTNESRGEARRLSGPCLPPGGLHLVRVAYGSVDA